MADGTLDFAAFERAFRAPVVRVRLDWRALRAADPRVDVDTVASATEVEGWYTTWYVAGGAEADYRGGARPLRLGDVVTLRDALDPERRERIAALAAGPGVTAVAAYALPGGGRLVLDGNHRLAATLLHGSPLRAVVATVHGPISARVLPDLAHFA